MAVLEEGRERQVGLVCKMVSACLPSEQHKVGRLVVLVLPHVRISFCAAVLTDRGRAEGTVGQGHAQGAQPA